MTNKEAKPADCLLIISQIFTLPQIFSIGPLDELLQPTWY